MKMLCGKPDPFDFPALCVKEHFLKITISRPFKKIHQFSSKANKTEGLGTY